MPLRSGPCPQGPGLNAVSGRQVVDPSDGGQV